MKIKKNFYSLVLLMTLFFVGGCETVDLDQLEDPSQLNAKLIDPVYAFNYIQLQLPDYVNSTNRFTQQVTRQMAMGGGNTYDNAYQAEDFNTNWTIAYTMLNAIQVMEPKAIQNKEFYALGAAKVIRCYVLLTLTDMYGDIPVSEALKGNENLTPHFDSSASVYTRVLSELDAAIEILGRNSNSASKIQDLYYSNQSSWITLAKTLKLKMYCTARLAGPDFGVNDIAAAISGILNEGDYIDTIAEDFQFKYGSTRFNPASRHPVYYDQYELGGGAYIGNYMFWTMTTEKGIAVPSTGTSTSASSNVDPRTQFYFFKQANVAPSNYDQFSLPNRTRPDHYNDLKYTSFYDNTIRTCYTVSNWTGGSIVDNGYWGRDHGNNGGIPPDSDKRTVCGVYPIGGAWGPPSSVQTSGNKGAKGAGVMPILLSSYVHFMKAEAILTLGIAGDARQELQQGIEQSIDKTINFLPSEKYVVSPTTTPPSSTALQAQKNWYVNTFILPRYDALPNNDKKLEMIIKEYYIAAWGNGIEPYNNYRRTGYPSNFQPTLEPIAGLYYSTALYPRIAVVNNPNAPTNVRTKRVFWDKASFNLE
ncbi:MAG: SusD/RagB family nutrient-binding outer membrane lipoprotein [Bacteroidetes bacterium]|nr:SusD/RagB family nutrient-binding outer membrane lipoprotein [Bacteroidota bacterium]